MITYTYKVSMTPGGIPVRCKLGQYDDDWTIVFTLYSTYGTFSIESGTTAKIRGTKRDGLGYSANATINISAGTVTVAGDKQITAVAGDNLFELVLLKGTKELSTANIIFSVEPAAMDAGTLVSDSQVQEILDMSADVIAASANVSTLRGNFAPTYSTGPYAVGDYVMHDNQLYRCTTATTTGEAWTAGHWTAVALGGDVSNLKTAFEYTAPYDLVAYGKKATKTVTDVTFIWHGNTCTVNGAAGGSRYHQFYDSPNALPAGVVHGSQLYVQCESSNSGVRLQIRYYNGTTHILLVETTTDTKVTIPNDAIGIMLRISVTNGTVCTDAAITMSVLTAETNVELTGKMQDVVAYTMALDKTNATTLTEESDIDQLTVGNYVVPNSTVAQALSMPMLAGGRLYAMDGNANNRFLQMYITLGDSRHRNLAFRGFNGANWTEWWQCETSDNTASAIASVADAIALKTVQGTNETLTAQAYAPYTSYNDFPMDSIIAVNRAPLADGPTGDGFLINDGSTPGYQRGICVTVTQSSTGATSTAFQIFVGYYGSISDVPIISYRSAIVSSGIRNWSPWAKLSQDRFLGATNIVIRASTAYKWFTDLDDAPINTIYQIDKDCVSGVLANHPAPGYSAVLMTYAFAVSTRHGMVQTLYSLQSNVPIEYIRYGWLNNTDDYRWTPWRKVVTEAVT